MIVVGDPSQIKPVLTLDSNTLSMLGRNFGVTEKYLSASAFAQTLVDDASRYGFYRKQDMSEDSRDHAKEVIQKGNMISFVSKEGKKKPYATDVKVKYPE